MFSLPQSLFKRVAVALFMLLCPCVAVAEPGFGFEDPLRFTYSAQGPTADTVFFLVFSKEGTISNTAIQLRSARDPDGQTLPPDAVTICITSGQYCLPPDRLQVAEKGTNVTLKLNSAYFHRAGEYRVLIDFSGAGPDKEKLTAQANLTLNRPAAEINLDQIKDQTIEISRSAPWSRVEKKFTISISESTGKTTLEDVKVVGQSVYRKDSRILVPGDVSVQLAAQDPANKNAPGVIRVDVAVKNLVHAGAFDTSLILNSPSLATRQVIPLRLVVSDNVFWPLIVIVMGVAGGFAVNYFSGKWRTRQLNKRAILRLQGELTRFRQVTKAAGNAATVEAMWRALRVAEESNEQNDLETVRATLTGIETDLSEFRKAHAEAKAKNYADLKQLGSEIDIFEQYLKPTPDDERSLHALQERLRDTERLLIDDQVDYAAEKLSASMVLFNDLKKSVFTRQFDELQKGFNQLKSQTRPAAQEESQELITEIEELLSENKLNEIPAKLSELALALEQLSYTVSGARFARGGPVTDAEPVRVLRPEERTAINIITEPAQRSTDTPIQFQIVDPENLFGANDLFRWNFGEAGSQHEDGRRAVYRYKEFGDYIVEVEVMRGLDVVNNLREPLTVLPRANADQSQLILARVQRSDLLLSLLALVLAGLTGLLALYVGKAFGTLSDYLWALLWGFGIDNSVRGFAGVLSKIGPGGGGE